MLTIRHLQIAMANNQGRITLMLILLFAGHCGLGFAGNPAPSAVSLPHVQSSMAIQRNVAPFKHLKSSKPPTGKSTSSSQETVIYSRQPNSLIVQAKQASISQLLKAIADQSGVVIHYSALPDALISAKCEGKLFSQVLECLIGSKVNVAYRYHSQVNDQSKQISLTHQQPEEIWVLGTDRADGHYATMACTLDSKASKTDETVKPETMDPHKVLLQMADLNDTQYGELRKQAISLLAAQGKTGDTAKDDATVATLQNAFNDKDPEIKAQAVFGLSNHDGSERAQVLEEAVSDQNPDVRLMAVDSANTDNPADRAILQQALQDNDETIKAAASDKLGIEYIEPNK
jgi:HEAT repeats